MTATLSVIKKNLKTLERFSDETLADRSIKSNNFWATLKITEAEVQQEIKDEIKELAYDPANQTPLGAERLAD
ncbi:hypothetical protein [Limosilactobacillus ingluviei]|uniref:hypothetical protein n=1 Tax=Limosilactobacillus ingluviei TaxID=148604 RepID=UPI000593385E|nr:hypothetical protein [Limosilactobacillus ingluviei]